MRNEPRDFVEALAIHFGTLSESVFQSMQRLAAKLERFEASWDARHSFARLTTIDGTRAARIAWCIHSKSPRFSVGDKVIVADGGLVDVGTVRTHARNCGHLIEWLRAKVATWETFEPLVSAQEFVQAVRRAADRRMRSADVANSEDEHVQPWRSEFLASLPAVSRALIQIGIDLQLIVVGALLGLYEITVDTVIGLGQDLWELVPARFRRRNAE